MATQPGIIQGEQVPPAPLITSRGFQASNPGDEHRLIDEEELRVALSLPTVRAVRELRYKKKIPFVKMGWRTIRYSLPSVIRALGKLEVKEAGANR